MGFTSNEQGSTGGNSNPHGGQAQAQAPKGPNFGQRLMQYGEQRNPLLGMLGHEVFGGGQQNQNRGAQPVPYADQPLPDGSQNNLNQSDLLNQPKAKGLNFSAIAKLLMGA